MSQIKTIFMSLIFLSTIGLSSAQAQSNGSITDCVNGLLQDWQVTAKRLSITPGTYAFRLRSLAVKHCTSDKNAKLSQPQKKNEEVQSVPVKYQDTPESAGTIEI